MFIYVVISRNILSPVCLVNLTFTFSSLVLAIKTPQWGYNISAFTLIVISLSLLFFNLGYLLARRIPTVKVTNRTSLGIGNGNYLIFEISRPMSFFLSFISFIVVLCYALFLLLSVRGSGIHGDFFSSLSQYRNLVVNYPDLYRIPVLLNIGLAFLRAYSYCCIFFIVYNMIYKYHFKRYLFAVVCHCIVILLGTGRGEIITLLSAVIFDSYAVLCMKKNRASNIVLLKIALRCFVIFIGLFLLLGILRNSNLDWFSLLSVYIGSPIICLDSFLNTTHVPSILLGQNTLWGFYNILRHIGIDIPFYSHHLPMIYWGGNAQFASNIYTGFYTYISDFGLFGNFIILFFCGYVFNRVWKKYTSRNSGLMVIFYGPFWGYASIMLFITERIFSTFISLPSLVLVFFGIIICKLFINVSVHENQSRIVDQKEIGLV